LISLLGDEDLHCNYGLAHHFLFPDLPAALVSRQPRYPWPQEIDELRNSRVKHTQGLRTPERKSPTEQVSQVN
jgi:hypothetical protein